VLHERNPCSGTALSLGRWQCDLHNLTARLFARMHSHLSRSSFGALAAPVDCTFIPVQEIGGSVSNPIVVARRRNCARRDIGSSETVRRRSRHCANRANVRSGRGRGYIRISSEKDGLEEAERQSKQATGLECSEEQTAPAQQRWVTIACTRAADRGGFNWNVTWPPPGDACRLALRRSCSCSAGCGGARARNRKQLR